MQEALEKLESDGAIVRVITAPAAAAKDGARSTPATELLPSPTVMGVGSPLPEGVTGNPHQPGVHNLRKKPRLPKTQLDYARLVARRHDGEAAVRSSTSRLSELEHEQVRERIRTAASKMEH